MADWLPWKQASARENAGLLMLDVDTRTLSQRQQELCVSNQHKGFVDGWAMSPFESIEFVSEWTRKTRERLGLRQADVAVFATELLEADGSARVLKQQNIDQLEKRAHKGVPDWFRYVRQALEEHDAENKRQQKLVAPKVRMKESDHPITLPDDIELIREVDIRLAMGDGRVIEEFPETGVVPFNRNFRRTLTSAPIEQLLIARGDGDSMMPTLINDDMVLIDTTQREIRQSDRIWALRIDDVGMIKRVRVVPGNGYELLSDNAMIPPQPVARDHVSVLGRVIWVGRRI